MGFVVTWASSPCLLSYFLPCQNRYLINCRLVLAEELYGLVVEDMASAHLEPHAVAPMEPLIVWQEQSVCPIHEHLDCEVPICLQGNRHLQIGIVQDCGRKQLFLFEAMWGHKMHEKFEVCKFCTHVVYTRI